MKHVRQGDELLVLDYSGGWNTVHVALPAEGPSRPMVLERASVDEDGLHREMMHASFAPMLIRPEWQERLDALRAKRDKAEAQASKARMAFRKAIMALWAADDTNGTGGTESAA